MVVADRARGVVAVLDVVGALGRGDETHCRGCGTCCDEVEGFVVVVGYARAGPVYGREN